MNPWLALSMLALAVVVQGVHAADPKLPAGNVTVRFDMDPNARCRARTLISYSIDKWANNVVGFDDPLAIYGLDDLSKAPCQPLDACHRASA